MNPQFNKTKFEVSRKSLDLQEKQTTYNEYYFIKSPKSENEDFQIVCGGLEHCESNYCVSRDSYIYYSIEYIVSGQCKFTIDKKEYKLGEGSMFFYEPHHSHKIENIGKKPLIKYFINFRCDNPENLDHSLFSENNHAINLSKMDWASSVFQQLQECSSSTTADTHAICYHLLKYLMHRSLKTRTQSDEKHPCSSYRTYLRVKTYLDTSYLSVKTISDVAQACNVSVCHVSRLFRKFANTSPTNHLITLRLNRALELLIQGDLLVKQIAEIVGFDDQFYFSNRFKKHFGVSPNNYKQIINKQSFTNAA